MAEAARGRRRGAEPLKYVLRLSGFETLKDEGFTVYFVRVAVESGEAALAEEGQRLWYVRKRYRDFWQVQQAILRCHGTAPQLPHKKYFGNLNPDFVKNRAHGLSVFLWELAASPAMCALRPVHEFLWSGVCVPPTRSMLPSTPVLGAASPGDRVTESMAAISIDDDGDGSGMMSAQQLYQLDGDGLSPPMSPVQEEPRQQQRAALSPGAKNEEDLVRQAASDIADVQGRIILTSCEDLQRSFAREGIYLPEADFVESDAPDSDHEDSGMIVKACSSFMPGIYKWYAGQPAANFAADEGTAEGRAARADTEGGRDPSRLYIGDFMNAAAPSSAAASLPQTPSGPSSRALIPRLRFVIIVVGSRGDVQPYVALGMALRRQGHYVRIAAHECFRSFVGAAKLGFAPLAGDPKELLRMVTENSMFSYSFVREGVASHRTWISEILDDAWDACTLPEHELRDGPETGPRGEREAVRRSVGEGPGVAFAALDSPFRADVVISNPPAFSGWHIAEALGVPLFTSFPMPWSRTTEFPSPFTSTKGESASGRLNWMSYGAVDRLMWLGAGDLINRWRVRTLRLAPIWTMSARGHRLAHDNRIPALYPWSPQMLPKPKDWGSHICIPGYWFLDDEMAKEAEPAAFEPPPKLRDFLSKPDDPPIFIGFGSIVVKDPLQLSTIIADTLRAMSKTHRFIVQAGWADVKVDDLIGSSPGEPRVLQIGAAPHRWLFERCKCVIHHGGAGTTAEGLRAGKPTVVVPFFGDQFFWARHIDAVRVGVRIPYTKLTAKRLCVAIEKALGTGMRMRAQVMAASIARENGTEEAIAFIEQRFLRMEAVRGMEIILRHPSERAAESAGQDESLLDADTAWTLRNVDGKLDFWRSWPYVEMTDKAAERKTPAPLRAINSLGRHIKIAGSAIRGSVARGPAAHDAQPPGVELQERPKARAAATGGVSPETGASAASSQTETRVKKLGPKRRLPSTSFSSRIPPGHTQYSWRRGSAKMLGHTKFSAGAEPTHH